MTIEQSLSYGMVFMVIIAIVMIMMFYKLRQNRKFAEGKIKCWFWPETGYKYYTFIKKEEDGIQIKAPAGHSCPRYFLHKNAIGWEKYPDNPPMGMKFMQIDVPAVIWPENNPEPIMPGVREEIVTSRLIDGLMDESFAAFSAESERMVNELEKELLKSKASRLNPTIIYALVAAAMIASIACAVMMFQTSGAITDIMRGMGI